MRAKQFLPEAPIGVNPKREPRVGSRPSRGHQPVKEGVIDVPALSIRIKAMRAQGQQDAQIRQQLVKEGIPIRFIDQAFAGVDLVEQELAEKASRQLCKSSTPDKDLGASNLASCKSQGLRARDGEKSHLIGHGNSSVRITVGGKKIKGKKYGGPLPDYGTRKGQ